MFKVNVRLNTTFQILVLLALAKFIPLLLFAGNYDIFRDEYYYLECSKHLDWGFVDHPPLAMAILAVSRVLFGESLLAIRIFAYITGAAIVVLTGFIAKEAGGGKYSQILAGFASVFAGTVLGNSGYFSMNVFDIFLISLFFYFLLRYINSGNLNFILLLGLLGGLALQNKLTFLFVAAGLFVALLLTPHRKLFIKKELWLAGAIAFVIILPFLIWQLSNGIPTLEFMRNASQRKNLSMSVPEFILNVMIEFNPVYIIFVLPALYYGLIDKEGKRNFIPVMTFVTVLFIFSVSGGKAYYMGVLQPVIIAVGAAAIERYSSFRNMFWLKPAAVVLVAASAVLVVPFALPVLSPDRMVTYTEFLGIKPSSGERVKLGLLPQFFADRFGWEEMVQKTAEAVNQLTPGEKNSYIIFTQNYGEAGAINYYRSKYNLKQAYSFHNSYWYWGLPEYTPSVYILVGGDLEGNREFFDEVIIAAQHRNKYAMSYENLDIYICRRPKVNIKEAWPKLKKFI